MNRNIIIFVSTLILYSSITAQTSQLHIPINFKKAYENKTRSMNGKPGVNYWQNHADYKIQATLEPASRKLTGSGSISYFNNSPDTLKQIILKLYPDIYRKGNVRDFPISPNSINEGMEISKLLLDGNEIKLSGDKLSPVRAITNYFVPLDKPLAPKSKIELRVDWNYTIANESQVRTGSYDSTTFFVAYWYPQVAVYDDIDGGDDQNYTGYTETYNEFGNYEVEINVPNNFVVWATGVLQNPKEVFSKSILKKYEAALTSDNQVNVIEKNDYKTSITIDRENLTYKFKAEYVPHVAFGTSDHFLWDASSLIVDNQTNRRAFVSAVYDTSTKNYSKIATIARQSIDYFSNKIPAWPYPYPAMTVFHGRGGMEFPMMCNDSAVPEIEEMVHLTSHEIAHTYFPFYMGTNERKYAWMDEGWATMLPFDFQTENAPGYDPRSRNAQSYSEYAGLDTDLPPMIPSHQMRSPSYRTASYRRPGAAYEFLRQMLGDQKFLEAMHEYIIRWNGKHPTPYDFFFTFNYAAKENLDWYWKPWFFDSSYPDLSIKTVKKNGGSINLRIENIGGLPIPVELTAYLEDGTSEIIYESKADIWKKGDKEIKVSINSTKHIIKLELGNSKIPDVDLKNNTAKFNEQ